MISEDIRSKLHPADAPNPIVWCERCQKEHKTYTFTQADYDVWLAEATKRLSDAIDKAGIERFFKGRE